MLEKNKDNLIPPSKKRKLDNDCKLDLQQRMIVSLDLCKKIAVSGEDLEPLFNLSSTCWLLYNTLFFKGREYLYSGLSEICEKKMLFEQMPVSKLNQSYQRHRANIKEVKDKFFQVKKHFSPHAKLKVAGLPDKVFKGLGNFIVKSTENGYFQLLSEIISEIKDFSVNQFEDQANQSVLFIATRHGYEKTVLLMNQSASYKDWFQKIKLDGLCPYITSDAFHNLALFGSGTSLLIKVYEVLPPPLDGDIVFPSVCADVIYNRSIKDSFNNKKNQQNNNEQEDMDDTASISEYIQVEDNLGWTVLHWAACLGYVKLLEEAVELGANINQATPDDEITPLHLACIKNHHKCVSYLLKKGARISICGNMYCDHPLLMAAAYGSAASLQILIDYMQKNQSKTEVDENLNINYVDQNNETALHLACTENRPECVQILVAAGIDVTIVNADGETALAIAEEKKYDECAKILEEKANSSLNLFNSAH